MNDIGPNQFRCDCCGEVFDKGWTDEEAEIELKDTFPALTTNNCGLVCDDCYKQMGF